MRNLMKKLEDEFSVAASLLTFALAIIGISNVRLTEWWHYLIAFAVLILVFFVFSFVVGQTRKIYTKYFERADISIKISDEMNALGENVHSIYQMMKSMSRDNELGYHNLLNTEIKILLFESLKKIELIECHTEKDPSNKFYYDEDLLNAYKEFLQKINL